MKDSLYTPKPFVERDARRLAAFLENHPFGTLISVDEGAPIISHVPFLFEHSAGTHGRLTGHLARANPHGRLLTKGETVLTLFQGPHAYVSPAWYATPGGVPTWNYAVVHVRGVPRLVEEPNQCAEILRRMTAAYESRLPIPWQFDGSEEKYARLLDMIVGLEIEITAIQGKFKLSQNRSPAERRQVIAKLQEAGAGAPRELADMMEEYYASLL
jgi:transcriptional regulator